MVFSTTHSRQPYSRKPAKRKRTAVAATTGGADRLMMRVNSAVASIKKPKLEPSLHHTAAELDVGEVDPVPMELEGDEAKGKGKGKGKGKEEAKALLTRDHGAVTVDEEEPLSLLGETSQSVRAPIIKSRV